MRLRIFLILLVTCFFAIADEQQIPRLPTNWKPIIGYKAPYSTAYYDANGFERTIKEKNEYVSGSLLVVSHESIPTVVEGKSVNLKSIAKHIIVECSSRMMIPIMDFYFDVEKPTRLNLPIAAFEYPEQVNGPTVLDKNSLIYKTFCPVYI